MESISARAARRALDLFYQPAMRPLLGYLDVVCFESDCAGTTIHLERSLGTTFDLCQRILACIFSSLI